MISLFSPFLHHREGAKTEPRGIFHKQNDNYLNKTKDKLPVNSASDGEERDSEKKHRENERKKNQASCYRYIGINKLHND